MRADDEICGLFGPCATRAEYGIVPAGLGVESPLHVRRESAAFHPAAARVPAVFTSGNAARRFRPAGNGAGPAESAWRRDTGAGPAGDALAGSATAFPTGKEATGTSLLGPDELLVVRGSAGSAVSGFCFHAERAAAGAERSVAEQRDRGQSCRIRGHRVRRNDHVGGRVVFISPYGPSQSGAVDVDCAHRGDGVRSGAEFPAEDASSAASGAVRMTNGSRKQEAGSRKQGAGSREQGAGRKERTHGQESRSFGTDRGYLVRLTFQPETSRTGVALVKSFGSKYAFTSRVSPGNSSK